MDQNKPKVFGHSDLTQRVCAQLNVPSGAMQVRKFSDGNIFVRVLEDLTGDVFFINAIGPPTVNDSLVETCFAMSALVSAGAARLRLIIPHVSYSLADKPEEFSGTAPRMRVLADMIRVAGRGRLADIVTVDLHSRACAAFFFPVQVWNLTAYPVVCDAVKRLMQDNHDIVLVATDAGSLPKVRAFARRLKLPFAAASKERLDHEGAIAIHELSGCVRGRTCLIWDDTVVSGGTIMSTVQVLMEAGARPDGVFAATSHFLYGESCLDWLSRCPLRAIFVSDSVDGPQRDMSPAWSKVHVISLAPLLAETIRRLAGHERLSVLMADF